MAHDPVTIKGYRPLSPEEIAIINDVQACGDEVGRVIGFLTEIPGVDLRWLIEAETQLKLGFMCAIRAIAKPESF